MKFFSKIHQSKDNPKGEIQNKQNAKQKTNSKMVDLNTAIPTITLNVNGADT